MTIRNALGRVVHEIQLVVRKLNSAQTTDLLRAESETGAALARIGADGKLYGTGAEIASTLALTGDISPASIGAHQNDYNPTGLSTATILGLTSSAAYNITGLAGGADGRVITIVNDGAFALTLTNEDGSSAAANRFSLTAAKSIAAVAAVVLLYDATDTRWRLIASSDAPTPTITKQALFTREGVLTVLAGTLRIYNKTGITWTISSVFLSVSTAPTGANIIVDVNKNGVTIYTTQANRPTIVAGAFTGAQGGAPEITSIADGDYLTMDVDQIGSTIAGSDLTVHIIFT